MGALYLSVGILYNKTIETVNILVFINKEMEQNGSNCIF